MGHPILRRLGALLACIALASPASAQVLTIPPLAPWVNTFTGDQTGTTDSAPALSAAVALGKMVGVPAGSYLLNTSVFPPIGSGVLVDPAATFSGAGLLDFRDAVPYQVSPVGGLSVTSKTYGSGYASFHNIFQRGDYAKVTDTGPNVVATFGEGDAAASGAHAWGGNFVGAASAAGGVAIAAEINPVTLDPAGLAYGLVVAAAGTSPAQNALQVQANNNASTFLNGINFNSTPSSQAVTGDLITSTGQTAALRGIHLGGTYSIAEVDTPSFGVTATPASQNSKVAVSGSSTGNPKVAAASAGAGATNINLVVAGLGTGLVTFTSQVRISTSSVPATAATACQAGEIHWGTGFIYVCVATNTWQRAALTTW